MYPDGDYPAEFLGNLSEVAAKKEIADVVASEDKTSNQAQDIEVKSANTKDKNGFSVYSTGNNRTASLPEKNQTETVNSAFDNSKNTPAPEKNRSSEVEKAENPNKQNYRHQ